MENEHVDSPPGVSATPPAWLAYWAIYVLFAGLGTTLAGVRSLGTATLVLGMPIAFAVSMLSRSGVRWPLAVGATLLGILGLSVGFWSPL
jgi:hypothetical protein